MFRIIFIKETFDCGDGYGWKGFFFEPEKRAIPFDFCGHKIWSSSLHVFIVIQKNIFSTLETLLHEIGHLVICTLFLYRETSRRVNRWYDYFYWRLLRLWHCD